MHTETPKMFEAAPFFFFRFPLLSTDIFDSLVSAEDPTQYLIELFSSEKLLREAVLIASPTLYQSLQQFNQLAEKKQKQAISSLLKYVLRMATRATPFGLFSAIAVGEWREASSIHLKLDQIVRKGRPDAAWIFKILDLLSIDESILGQFKVARHPLLVEKMGRIILPISRKEENKEKEISVRNSPLVSTILEKTTSPIFVTSLLENLIKEDPTLDQESLLSVIRSLIDKEILYPNFFPSLLTENPFTHILECLKEVKHPIADHIRAVEIRLERYNQSKPGEGEVHFLELQQLMNEFVTLPNVIQVDSVYHEKLHLNQAIASELSNTLEALWALSPPNVGIPHLRDYHKDFLDKYGINRIIPIQEVAHPMKGLGIPEAYQKAEITQGQYHEDKLKTAYLFKEILKAYCEERKEIILDDAFIKQFGSSKWIEAAPTSVDLLCEVISSSQENIDKGDFLLFPHSISGNGEGCATMGRFLYLLDQKQQQVARFLATEAECDLYTEYIESSFCPNSARSANVCTNPNLRNRFIDLGYSAHKEEEIFLSDVYVGATTEHLYLTDQKGEKTLNLVSLNVLNIAAAPDILRLMREISKDRYRFLFPFYLGKEFAHLPFTPRFRYNKTIFVPASWNVSHTLISSSPQDQKEKIVNHLKSFCKEWKVPRFIFMTELDNRMLLDTHQDTHLLEIAHKLKHAPENTLVFTEKVGMEEWIKSDRGYHAAEYGIAFRKHQAYASPPFSIPKLAPSVYSSRLKLPGSEWIFVKLYVPQISENRFLVEVIAPLIEKIGQALTKWFFIRYQDKIGPHIRFRCKVENKEALHYVMDTLRQWFTFYIENGYLKDVAFTPYERELERYGGEEAIEEAEGVFFADSELTLSLLGSILRKEIDLPDFMIASLGLLEFAKGFGYQALERNQFFTQKMKDSSHLDGFREWKQKAIFLYASSIADDGSNWSSQSPFPQDLLEKTHSMLKLYKAKLLQITPAPLPNELDNIFASLLHMHCNRLMGTDRLKEEKAIQYTGKMLSTLAKLTTPMNDLASKIVSSE